MISVVGLVPEQGHALGLELLIVSLVIGGVIARLPTTRSGPTTRAAAWSVRWTLRVGGTVPLIVGGASVLASTGGGLYWVAAGIAFAIAGAVANAWVLLVEIPR